MNVALHTGSFRNGNIIDILSLIKTWELEYIEFNLRPIINGQISAEQLKNFIENSNLKICNIAGGWCDFFVNEKYFNETIESVNKQIAICKFLKVNMIRLFFGLLDVKYTNKLHFHQLISNVNELADKNPEIIFIFENHDYNSINPDFLFSFFSEINRPNIRLNFDPVNFERGNVSWERAFEKLWEFIYHVHIKGYKDSKICSYRNSSLKFDKLYSNLKRIGYDGFISLEYEGEEEIISNTYLDYIELKIDISEIK